ncbi:MAG: Maf family protein [Alphaproteobacteria bacterium]
MTAVVLPVVLASASKPRARILAGAGVPVEIVPAHVDEDEVKLSLRAEGADAARIAEALAELKALRISQRMPGRLVVGADQTLAVDDVLLDKPRDLDEARGHLQRLQGRSHRLLSAACVVLDGRRIWGEVEAAELTMRPLSAGFIEDYLQRVGEAVTASVGAYQLEGLGAQLFARIRGDYFTILGLPLLPLLAFLRDRGVLAT